MKRYAGLKDWLRTPSGVACAVICAMSGFLLGLDAWWTFAQPPDPTYHADFTGAHWIRAVPTTDTGYFRKKFYVTERVTQAWISIAATDYYEFSINGVNLIIPQTSLKIYPQMAGSFIAGDQETQFDLTPYILPGENCITVYVRRRMLGCETNLLVKGLVSEGTHSQWLYSDSSWKAKPVPDDFVGLDTWTMPGALDDTWPNAEVVDRPVPGSSAQPMPIPTAVFEKPVEGHWICNPDPSETQSYFRRDFYCPWGTKETWLELSTPATYEIYLNDRLVSNAQLMAELQGAGAGATASSSALAVVNNAELINLGPWLSWGKNRLEIRAENCLEENPLLGEILFVQRDGSVRSLSSDSSWLSRGALTSSAWVPAKELAPYGAPPYGEVMKLSYPLPQATQEIGREIFNGLVLGIFVLAAWGLAWIVFSRMLADRRDIPFAQALIIDALAQVPVILALVVVGLASFDIRIRPEQPFEPIVFWLVIAGSAVLRLCLWRGRPSPKPALISRTRFAATRGFVQSYGFGIALAAIVVMAFVIRVSGLATFSLDQDEVFIRNVTHGIVERGYPSVDYHGLLYRLTTYELLPWPQVVCAILTGWQDWSLRVPSLLFGTAVAGLLGLFGSRWFDRRTGLLAALIYAGLSWNIHWSRHCFHLQQCQFSALLCFYTYYLAIRKGGGVDPKYFPLACILFCTTYLTWEGSGFILPAFAVAIVALHPTDWSWLKQFHFWTGLCFVSAVVLCQLCDRAITLPPYLGLGSGLSDISSPTLAFLDPNSDLLFYISHLFFSEAHALLIILLFLGVPFCWHHKPTRYVLTLFFTLLGCYSGLLPIYSVRYCYFYQTLVVLGGCAVAIQFYDRIVALAGSVSWPWIGRWARWSAAGLILLVVMAATETGLKIYRLTYNVQNPDFFSRQNDGYIQYKNPSDYVSAHFRAGDTVVGVLPHTFMHFSGKFSYGLNSLLLKRMYYLRNQNPPSFVDRYSGTTSFRDMLELQDAFWNHHRVWIVASPLLALDEGSDPPTKAFLEGISRIVYEDSYSRIYLWDGGGDPTDLPSNKPPVVASSTGAMLNPAVFGSSASSTSNSTSSTSASGSAPAGGSSTSPSPAVTSAPHTAGSPSVPTTGSLGSSQAATRASPSSLTSSLSGSVPSSLVSALPSSSSGGFKTVPSTGSGGTPLTSTTAFRPGVPGQYEPPGTIGRATGGGDGFGGASGGPSTTTNPASTSAVGVNSHSYGTPSSGLPTPAETIPPTATASAYRNILPSP
jgi:4-amino-4-deoxy-L-arabinose transferase-like glycosyltransferase